MPRHANDASFAEGPDAARLRDARRLVAELEIALARRQRLGPAGDRDAAVRALLGQLMIAVPPTDGPPLAA